MTRVISDRPTQTKQVIHKQTVLNTIVNEYVMTDDGQGIQRHIMVEVPNPCYTCDMRDSTDERVLDWCYGYCDK
jgi:hypothetical protein